MSEQLDLLADGGREDCTRCFGTKRIWSAASDMHVPCPDCQRHDAELGRLRRDEAVARVDVNAAPDWKGAAMDALRAVCRVKDTITTDDVWFYLRDNMAVEPPHEPRAMGPIMRNGVRLGLLRPSAIPPRLSKRPVCHGRPLRVWLVIREGRT